MDDHHPSGIDAYDHDERDLYGACGGPCGSGWVPANSTPYGPASDRHRAVLTEIGALHVASTGQLCRLLFFELTEQGSLRAAQRVLHASTGRAWSSGWTAESAVCGRDRRGSCCA